MWSCWRAHASCPNVTLAIAMFTILASIYFFNKAQQ
ncbi:hypothetical protein mRhiFer1_000121 [Rhinolophus ferrumequinum]|uniref:Uncharacterized protein n=1 Tax=Rhinolophus ferrumequinum TaxID=59479 RepID=A0A7J7SG57_RHIFE|nr:hypothetical protein mRhiFer1_000121 [Rhinolophus ferrumequinum]